ncbi:hypothetical protein BPNPMPFG_004513 [Mesorhizobium sp. AR07]|uniref:hypothetical protein n=1 Tax=Mesorhizobium sp. AR07 TaxID=2865838 RepID=UPI00215E8CFE|nr:hypothetical protein [Mesorhizobium sp. AR07]UVK42795.1 hypothetical protein BPNPMPFG_004513 [Mesorhizobium sp. AR07]
MAKLADDKSQKEMKTNLSAKDRQYQKFVAKARELETDESEENFDRVLKKVVKAAPRDDKPKKAG